MTTFGSAQGLGRLLRRNQMGILRLFGVGVLFAVFMPMHGTRYQGDAQKLPELTQSAGATPNAKLLAASRPAGSAAESARLRALRSSESDLFKNLPDASRPTETASRVDEAPREGREVQAPRDATEDTSWLANLRMPDMPIRAHERVRQYVDYFTQNADGRRVFRTWLKRSGRYSKTVSGALREQLMPQDLQAVVFVESGYSPKAVSTAGAVGLWQFMASTARIYGLAVEADIDERRSVERASQAAVKHLSDMRDRFGSWELALAAYNMGYKALVDRIKDVSTNDFWMLSELEGVLPRETQLYVPKVLAAAIILRNLDRFGLDDVRVDPPVATADLDVPSGTPLAVVARASGTSVKAIRELNPEILSDTVPDRGRTLAVHVPSSGIARAQTILPRLLEKRDREGLDDGREDFDWGSDDAPRRSASRRRGDFFDAEPRTAATLDEPRRPARVARNVPRDDDQEGPAGRVILYRVGERESITGIAKAFGTSASQIASDNYLDPDGKLQKGMLLIVEVSSKSMNRIMKRRTQGRIDDSEREPSRAADGQPEDDSARGSGPGITLPADVRSNGTRG
ncbi:MAG: transglycosylase SLT domain-containing protein [Myxococcales bacterium]|nr:transglycosylase SLT domain-containing protein [Myxococcales bacterium]